MTWYKKAASRTNSLSIVCVSIFAHGHNKNPVASKFRLEGLPKAFEIHLALSAAPQYLRAGATVYVLDPARGYILERKGTNGFTCYVQRTDYRREDFRNDLIQWDHTHI